MTSHRKPDGTTLRKGFSTGACASAAAKAAMLGLLRGEFPREVVITLPRGETPSFAVERAGVLRNGAYAVVRKDAGDDPDVTHRALILVSIEPQENTRVDDGEDGGKQGSVGESLSLEFRGGRGVGIVTLAGLPLAVGEPAINPAPRRMILQNLEAAITECASCGEGRFRGNSSTIIFRVTIAVADGVRLAERTWNSRLGIMGGLSILGTTGIVIPYSCSSWIHAIHRGVDVARANGVRAIAAATGRTSETSVRELLGLDEGSVIDMGDFAGGMLKYMRKHPVGCLTIAGGFGKMVKFSQGNSDLHSGRSQVDFSALAAMARECDGDAALCEGVGNARSAGAVLALLAGGGDGAGGRNDGAGEFSVRDVLLRRIAEAARANALRLLEPSHFPIGIVIVDREGCVLVHLTAE